MTLRRYRIKIPSKSCSKRRRSMLSELLSKYNPEYIIGIDEVGWGAIAGPVGVGCAVYPVGYKNDKIKDSKKYTTEKSRLNAYSLVYSTANFVDYTTISVQDLHELGPGVALQQAFKDLADRTLVQFPSSIVIVDGNRDIGSFDGLQYAFPKADEFVCAVSAASIIAKVSRDRHMKALHTEFPEFKWAVNKGYPTPEQMAALVKYGVTVHHRRNIKSVVDCEKKYGAYLTKTLPVLISK